jgi:hypothetical protein
MARAEEGVLEDLKRAGVTRRKAIGLAGVLGAMALVPRWVFAQTINVKNALRSMYTTSFKKKNPAMSTLAAGLKTKKGLKTQTTSVPRQGGGTMKAIVFPDGTIFADGAGDGQGDMGDYEFKGAAESIVDTMKSTTKSAAISQKFVDPLIETFQDELPSLNGQGSYPVQQTAQLFATAKAKSLGQGPAAQKQVKALLDKFVVYLGQEKKLRDQLAALKFVSKSKSEISAAEAKQKKLFDRIHALRTKRILPLLRQVVSFTNN